MTLAPCYVAVCRNVADVYPNVRPGRSHARNGGRLQNDGGPLARGWFLKWQWSRLVEGALKPPDNGYRLPLNSRDTAWPDARHSVDTMTGTGQATALLQVSGVNIVTGPMLSARAIGAFTVLRHGQSIHFHNTEDRCSQ
jgi:hypothetical protein